MQPRTRGFTLLELMVVVVIIGLLITGAIISLGATGTDRELQQERDKLAALIAYAREHGGILSLEYGIRCGQHGYRFVYFNDNTRHWSPEVTDDTLRMRRLPAGLHLTLVIEGRDIVLDDQALQYDAKAAKAAAQSLGSYLSKTNNSLIGLGPGGNSNARGLGAASSNSDNGGLDSDPDDSDPTASGGGLGRPSADDAPQMLLFSNGDMNAFSLTIVRDGVNRSTTLQSSADGSVQVGDIVEPKS